MRIGAAPLAASVRSAWMKLIELTATKGGVVWVNPELVLYAGLPDGAESSMYGANNSRSFTRLHFAQGPSLDVRETLPDVVTRLTS
jgi:hypothetical protein